MHRGRTSITRAVCLVRARKELSVSYNPSKSLALHNKLCTLDSSQMAGETAIQRERVCGGWGEIWIQAEQPPAKLRTAGIRTEWGVLDANIPISYSMSTQNVEGHNVRSQRSHLRHVQRSHHKIFSSGLGRCRTPARLRAGAEADRATTIRGNSRLGPRLRQVDVEARNSRTRGERPTSRGRNVAPECNRGVAGHVVVRRHLQTDEHDDDGGVDTLHMRTRISAWALHA